MRLVSDAVSDVPIPDAIFRWASLLVVQGVMAIGMVLGYLGTRKKVDDVKDQASDAKVQATLAAELAAPTGNGYAGRTEDALREIKDAIVRVEQKVDTHIQDHARSSFTKDRNELH